MRENPEAPARRAAGARSGFADEGGFPVLELYGRIACYATTVTYPRM